MNDLLEKPQEAEAKARRSGMIISLGLAIAMIGGGFWFFSPSDHGARDRYDALYEKHTRIWGEALQEKPCHGTGCPQASPNLEHNDAMARAVQEMPPSYSPGETELLLLQLLILEAGHSCNEIAGVPVTRRLPSGAISYIAYCTNAGPYKVEVKEGGAYTVKPR